MRGNHEDSCEVHCLGAGRVLLSPSIVLADTAPGFDKIVERLCPSFQSEQQMPLGRNLYADSLFGHPQLRPGRAERSRLVQQVPL